MPKGKRIEPLDLAELENNPSLNGMLDFRDVQRDRSTHVSPIGSAPIGLNPPVTLTARDTTATDRSPSSGSDEPPTTLGVNHAGPSTPTGFPPTGVRPTGSASVNLADVLAQLAATSQVPRSRGKIVRAMKVEDGHSATQNALYWHLWRTGQQVNGSRSRFVQAGYGHIQAALGIDRSNVQDAIRELQKKLSIQIVKANTVGSATIYEVFSCEDILAKRRSEGLVWVRKFGTRRADLLVNPDDEGESLAPIGQPPIGATGPMGVTPTDAIGVAPIQGIGATPIQIVKEENSKETSSSRSAVWQALANYGATDDDAVTRLLTGVRTACPDASNAEILHFIAAKGELVLRRNSKVGNPIGFLVVTVPKCFEGESFRQFRQAQAQGRESQIEDTGQRQRCEAILNDPNASEPEKRLALAVLANT